MRAYLAIIKDSFREALASRVLWILLVLITLVLLMLAPLSSTQQLTTGVRENDVDEWPDLVEKLQEAARGPASTPVEHVWGLLDKDEQKQVLDFKRVNQRPNMREVNDYQKRIRGVEKILSKLLERRDFYNREAWRGERLTFEGQQLSARLKELDDEEVQRLNRIALETAFPGIVETSPPTSFQLRYALYGDLGDPLPVSKKQLANGFRAGLPWFIDKILLSIGLLVAVLVTAPIIPQTFDPGSLHLLLSKPIFRWLLYVTKFLGGCAFVVLSSTYLFVGLWLLLGWRMGIWEARLLWCIPIYAFVFATYYSVAALAGLFWRNTVVSIIVAFIFWGMCFGIGVLHGTIGSLVDATRLVQVVPAGDDILAVSATNKPVVWNAALNRWDPVFLADDIAGLPPFIMAVTPMLPMVGPVYDPRNKQLVAVTVSLRNGQRMVSTGAADKKWKHTEIVASPSSPLVLLSEPSGAPLLVTNDGFYRLASDLRPAGAPVKFLGFNIPLGSRGPLQDVGPKPRQSWASPVTAAIDAQSGRVAVCSRSVLMLYEPNSDGTYIKLREQKLEGKEEQQVRLTLAGDTILVVRGDAKALVVAADTLKVRATVELPGKQPAIAVAASPDRSAAPTFALLLEDGKLWILQTGAGDPGHWRARVRGQGDISAVAFDADGKLLVIDRTTRLSRYTIAPPKLDKQWSPPLSMQEWAYRYGVQPLYWVCPKPGEFYKTVQYLLLNQAENQDEAEVSSGTLQTQLKPWAPVWSSLAFMLVMLAIGCLYMQRQEF